MKKKLELYFSSFKASACNKPTALLMFVMLIIVFTTAIGFPLREIFKNVETELFGELFQIVDIDKENSVDYNYYKDIAEKLKPINDKNLFDNDNYRSFITISCNNPSIIKQDKEKLEAGSMGVGIELSPYHFTQEELDTGVQKMMGSKAFFRKFDLKQGDKIVFEGSEFTLYENHKDDLSLTIPYTATVKDFRYSLKVDRTSSGEILGDVKFYGGIINLYGKQNIATSYELDILKNIGVKPYRPSFGGIILPMIMLAVIMLGGVASIITIYKYILKINSRRYAIYKIIGVPPMTVAGIMLTESLVLTGFGVGLGLLIEVLINNVAKIEVLLVDKLIWLHCISLVAITLLTTITAVGIKIIAHAKAVPASAKYLQ